jgi:hypothetical protein
MHDDFSLDAGEKLGRDVVNTMFPNGFFRQQVIEPK